MYAYEIKLDSGKVLRCATLGFIVINIHIARIIPRAPNDDTEQQVRNTPKFPSKQTMGRYATKAFFFLKN
jgi:hypothetical protein